MPRQIASRIAAIVVFACLGGTLGGCTGIHLLDLASAPAASNAAAANDSPAKLEAVDMVTGSADRSGTLGYAGSDHGDWDFIRNTVSTSLAASPTARIEWANSTSGNSGTITELVSSGVPKGRDCRSFATTISTVDGVRLYHAEICKSVMNTWEFSKIAAADAR